MKEKRPDETNYIKVANSPDGSKKSTKHLVKGSRVQNPLRPDTYSPFPSNRRLDFRFVSRHGHHNNRSGIPALLIFTRS